VNDFNDISKNNGTLPLNVVAKNFGILQTRNEVIPGRFYSLMTRAEVPSLTEEIVYEISGKNY
jgi:hypothetical protein